jgi:tRNA threonylcarbamoyl adenosine modification protein (Sua5/YciO/YrdC/YwlC family)
MNHPDRVQEPNFAAAAEPLLAGQLVVLPTDTLYGVVGSVRLPATVERLYALRQRELDKPCIILIHDLDDLAQLGVDATPAQRAELSRHWPGPVSVVLPCPGEAQRYLHRGSRTLALRQPDYPALQALLRQTGPLLAPSANPAGQPPATTIAQARHYFGDAVAVYVDGGPLAGQASQLIALAADGKATTLRP